MANAAAPEGKSLPRSVAQVGAATLDRLASFRLVYVAIFVFALLYIASVQGAQSLLQSHFRRAVEQAVRVSPADGPVVEQIQRRVGAIVRDSRWVRIGRVHVNAFVLGADERIPIYVLGRSVPPPPASGRSDPYAEAQALLPATRHRRRLGAARFGPRDQHPGALRLGADRRALLLQPPRRAPGGGARGCRRRRPRRHRTARGLDRDRARSGPEAARRHRAGRARAGRRDPRAGTRTRAAPGQARRAREPGDRPARLDLAIRRAGGRAPRARGPARRGGRGPRTEGERDPGAAGPLEAGGQERAGARQPGSGAGSSSNGGCEPSIATSRSTTARSTT